MDHRPSAYCNIQEPSPASQSQGHSGLYEATTAFPSTYQTPVPDNTLQLTVSFNGIQQLSDARSLSGISPEYSIQSSYDPCSTTSTSNDVTDSYKEIHSADKHNRSKW